MNKTQLTVERIAGAVRQTIREYLEMEDEIFTVDDVYDINCGLCDQFAEDVIDRLGGENDSLYLNWIEDMDEDLEDHSHAVIVFHQGDITYFFDSETPQGITDLNQLPVVLNDAKTRSQVLHERDLRTIKKKMMKLAKKKQVLR